MGEGGGLAEESLRRPVAKSTTEKRERRSKSQKRRASQKNGGSMREGIRWATGNSKGARVGARDFSQEEKNGRDKEGGHTIVWQSGRKKSSGRQPVNEPINGRICGGGRGD